MSQRRSWPVFALGALAGLAALGFNFLLRLGGIAAFPPESALSAFLRVIPASLEEPMVQQFGDMAGVIGLVSATAVAALIYGFVALAFDRYGAEKTASAGLRPFEGLVLLGLVPWLLFGLALFPLDGDAAFGVGSPYAAASTAWAFPFTLLLALGIFAWALSLRYHPPALERMATPVSAQAGGLAR